jgi:2-polyprenyl-3-methyl-5-hydroxy-6-metoxy-1,4-benzoquinol methylase
MLSGKKRPSMKNRRWARFSPKRLLFAFSRLNFRRMEECATIIRWLNSQPGEHILDIGCGDGAYDKKIARTGAMVQGIDIHEKRLSAARKYYRGDRTEFRYMDASCLEFPDASFDKAMSLCVIEHLEDDVLVMRNVARVLKPGGLFVFSADSLSTPGITPDERARHQRKYAVNTFYTVAIVRDKLARAGFDIVETRYVLSTPGDLKFVRLSWKLDRLPGFLRFLRLLGYTALGTARKAASMASKRRTSSDEGGLTLLVMARKGVRPQYSRPEA